MSTTAPKGSKSPIVAHGGSVEVLRRYQPKRTFFTVLSALWLFPSAGAVVVIAVSPKKWLHADSVLNGLKSVGIDEWIALALLLAHPIFFWLAWRHYRNEPLKEVATWEPNPDRDPAKLY